MDGIYRISEKTVASASTGMDSRTVKNLWRSFTLKTSELEIVSADGFFFRVGDAPLPALSEGGEYALEVSEKGICVVGRDFPCLMRGFFALILMIEQDNGEFFIRTASCQSKYRLKNRMIHICVFPENDLYFIKKLIRLSALCQYTHIIIEFWGMLKYDCLPALSWDNAFTKDEARELIRECRELGIEPVPMFNMLGHATASRVLRGKHVVLDRYPELERLFTPDGWAWNIRSDEVKALLKSIRTELYELFGKGEYIHIGCDEAYYISHDKELRALLPEFLSYLTSEVESEGRRPMLWMDMLLESGSFKDCYTVAEKGEAEILRRATAPSTVFVDWQYDCNDTPIPSLAFLKDCGHDVIGAPWYNEGNFTAHIETVLQNDLFGVMLTTWHKLRDNMPSILAFAKKCGAASFIWTESATMHTECATMLRRLSFEGNDYASAGWAKEQVLV